MIAQNEMIKSGVLPQPAKCEANESGTATSRTLIHELRKSRRAD